MSATNPPPARKPVLTAPVSRFLGVADAARSLAFYSDVLGFDVQPVREEYGFPAVAEVVSGPARIQLGLQDRAVDSTGEDRPRGSAILFFETGPVRIPDLLALP